MCVCKNIEICIYILVCMWKTCHNANKTELRYQFRKTTVAEHLEKCKEFLLRIIQAREGINNTLLCI